MRITREGLLNTCVNYTKQAVYNDRGITAVYLTGSMLTEFPFIDGTTDVDLIIVHDTLTNPQQEVIRLTDEVSLDINHYGKAIFSDAEKFKKNILLGCSLCFDPIVFYGKGHWFEFVLASNEATFFLPDNVFDRAFSYYKNARYFFSVIQKNRNITDINFAWYYLHAIEYACSAIACLRSKPLPLRKFISELGKACSAVSSPDIVGDTYDLILGEKDPTAYFEYFFNSWKYYFEFFNVYARNDYFCQYKPERKLYYEEPVKGFWKDNLPSAIWIMAYTWSEIGSQMKLENNEYFTALFKMLEIHPSFYDQRKKQLDMFLDKISVKIETWGKENGLEKDTTVIF